jgi:hypothetical protein
MDFETAVNRTPGLPGCCRPGLQALPAADRSRITASDPRRIRGSVNLDAALSASRPSEPRWDYGIGLPEGRNSDQAVWVEVHPASSRHVEEVLNKHRWLRHWLESEAQELERISRHFVWLASGKVSFPASSPQRRLVAQAGIRFHARVLDLDRLST